MFLQTKGAAVLLFFLARLHRYRMRHGTENAVELLESLLVVFHTRGTVDAAFILVALVEYGLLQKKIGFDLPHDVLVEPAPRSDRIRLVVVFRRHRNSIPYLSNMDKMRKTPNPR